MNKLTSPIFGSPVRWGVAAVAAGTLAACGTMPGPGSTPASAPVSGGAPQAASAPVAAAPAPAAPAPSVSRPAAAGASVAGQSRTFSTQLATYTSVGFETVPGWGRDDFAESWPAFLGSCKVLTGRGTEWRQVCDRARGVDDKSNPAIRSFFEREFSAYQIRDDDRRPDGVVTGYFEPEITGSRQYAPPFIYPVYGQPEDMLFADARKLPAGSGTVAARVEGRNVAVQSGLSTRDMGAPGLYALDLSTITRDTLDRKVRLRIEGKRLLPYYTREEIETKGAPNARVLAFVNSATALYEMQIQGSGRIRLPSGEVIRVAYAEQNGQPFRPTLAQSASGKARSPVKVRGGAMELQLDDGDDDEDNANDTSVIRTRGFTLARPVNSGAVVVPGRRAAGPVTGSGIKDPSYVFFKESPGTGGGPVGAFGVPLVGGPLDRGRPAQHAAGLPGLRLHAHARHRHADAAAHHRAGHRRRDPRRGARRLLLRQRPAGRDAGATHEGTRPALDPAAARAGGGGGGELDDSHARRGGGCRSASVPGA